MYRAGHYGAALLVFAPLGSVLVAAGRPTAALVTGVVVVGLTPLPDYDQRVPFVDHRGSTHTVGFALLVGLGVGAAGALVGAPPGGAEGSSAAATLSAAGLGFLAGTLSILAHLAADVITPAGIAPFWPVSARNYSLSWVRAANTAANYLLLAAGVAVAGLGLYAGTRVAGL